MNDVVIGAWREGLTKTMALDLAAIEQREKQGFRLFPQERDIIELTHILNAYDDIIEELMLNGMEDSCDCEECQCSDTVSINASQLTGEQLKVIELPARKKPKSK